MGRRRRESGHRQGGLPPVKITPKEQGQPLCPPVCPYHATQSLNANLQSPEPRMLERWRFEATDPSSPESGRSGPSQNNFAHSISTSYTGRLAEARHLSPEPPTPTSSSVSAYYLSQNGEHPGRRFRHHESLPRSDPSETGVQKIGGMSSINMQMLAVSDRYLVDIIGIESRVSNDDTQQYLGAPPEYLSHRGPLTINQQRLPRTHGPWAPLPFRFEEHYLNTDDTMEGVQDAIPAPEARERGGGGRTGPLSPIGRRQAGDVRRLGACLRCTIMREKVSDTLALRGDKLTLLVRCAAILQQLQHQRPTEAAKDVHPSSRRLGDAQVDPVSR